MNNEILSEDGRLYVKTPLYREDGEPVFSDYECSVLEMAQIAGLAQPSKRRIDGENYFVFSIHTYISLKERFSKEILNKELFCQFFEELLRLYENMRTYLLDNNSVSLEPGYIFYDEKDDRYIFLPIAEPESPISKKYETLLTFFADICSVEEKDVLEFIFEAFGFLNNEGFEEISFIKEIVNYKYRIEKKNEQEDLYAYESFDDDSEVETDEKPKIKGTFIISNILLLIAFWFSYVCKYEFKYGVVSMAAVFIAVGLMGYEVLKVTDHLPKQKDI